MGSMPLTLTYQSEYEHIKNTKSWSCSVEYSTNPEQKFIEVIR